MCVLSLDSFLSIDRKVPKTKPVDGKEGTPRRVALPVETDFLLSVMAVSDRNVVVLVFLSSSPMRLFPTCEEIDYNLNKM